MRRKVRGRLKPMPLRPFEEVSADMWAEKDQMPVILDIPLLLDLTWMTGLQVYGE